MEFCSCARGRQWCGIIHYYWWTASIKPRLLFSRAGYASWGLSLSSVYYCCFLRHQADFGSIWPYTYQSWLIQIIQTVSTNTAVLNIYFSNRSLLENKNHTSMHKTYVGQIWSRIADSTTWACLLGMSLKWLFNLLMNWESFVNWHIT